MKNRIPSIMEVQEIASKTGYVLREGRMVPVIIDNAWNEYKKEMKLMLEYEINKKDEERAFDAFWKATENLLKNDKKNNAGINIGEFSITNSTLHHDKFCIYHESGEGGEFSKKKVEKVIKNFYTKEF